MVPEEELKSLSASKETLTVSEEELKKLETEGVLIVSEDELAPLTEEEKEIDHGRLVSILQELGDIFGFVTRSEEFDPDKVYRYDVTWREYERHSPVKVFEVEASHQVDLALSRLVHAFDLWRPELYLIVADEADLDRARRLVEPRVRGAYARIAGRLKVLAWIEVKKLYDDIKSHKELIKDLMRR